MPESQPPSPLALELERVVNEVLARSLDEERGEVYEPSPGLAEAFAGVPDEVLDPLIGYSQVGYDPLAQQVYWTVVSLASLHEGPEAYSALLALFLADTPLYAYDVLGIQSPQDDLARTLALGHYRPLLDAHVPESAPREERGEALSAIAYLTVALQRLQREARNPEAVPLRRVPKEVPGRPEPLMIPVVTDPALIEFVIEHAGLAKEISDEVVAKRSADVEALRKRFDWTPPEA